MRKYICFGYSDKGTLLLVATHRLIFNSYAGAENFRFAGTPLLLPARNT